MNTPNDSSTPSQTFVISRILRAPRDLVWKVWTDVEHLQKWFGPSGCTIPNCKMDFKPGGIFHYCLRTPDGHEMWGKWTFLEIVKPERLVLIQSFSDKDGGITRHPLSADWPRETLSTTIFAENGGETTITLRWAAHNSTEIERKTFDSSHASMQQGWGGTFAQLDRYLEQTFKGTGK